MFKKWQKKQKEGASASNSPPTTNSSSDSNSPTSITPPPPTGDKIKLQKQNFSQVETDNLNVHTSENDQWPWGDGKDRVFGIENFGFSCYVASIFQTLYHLPEFRLAVLETPVRDQEAISKRQRRITMNGKELHGFALAMKDELIDKTLIENLSKRTECKNSQGNISLVGFGSIQASSEQRKRNALVLGPLLNVDTSHSTEYGLDDTGSGAVFSSLKDTFEAIVENGSDRGIVSPWLLIEVIKRENEMFREAMHQDAHEFLNFLINSLNETNNIPEGVFSSLFGGELTSEAKCLTCNKKSLRDEKFFDLSVDIQQHSSITNSLKLFSKIEKLNQNNKFHCEQCESLQEAEKCIKLKKLPKVLSFHLKRFQYSEQLGRMVKLFHRVEYTKTLRVFNVSAQAEVKDKLYELYSVVVHVGGGPYHGHYISLVKTESYGWLLFDDESVEKVDENFVYKFFGDGAGIATAYLVFYKEVKDEKKFQEAHLYSGFDEVGEEEVEVEVESTPEVEPSSMDTMVSSFESVTFEKPSPVLTSSEPKRRGSVFMDKRMFGFKKKPSS